MSNMDEHLSPPPAEMEASQPEQSIGSHWPVLFLSMAISAFIAVRLGQDVSWDVLNYHFYSGYAFLHKPLRYDFAPAQVQTLFNPLLHVLSYLFLAYLPAKLAAALLGAIQGLNLYLVFQISETLFRRWEAPYRHLLSLGNAAAGFYGVINMMELGATYGDNMVSVLTLTGLLLVFRYLLSDRTRARSSTRLLWIAGASIGVSFALKLTVVIHVVAVAVGLAVVLPALQKRLWPLISFYGGLAAGFIAAYGFWGIDLYREYRNPVFPYLNNIFRSPYYDLQNAMDARFMPRNWQEILFYPFFFARKNHTVSEILFRDVRLALCYAACVLLIAFALFRLVRHIRNRAAGGGVRRDYRCLLFFALFFVISYAAWQYIFSVYRYLAVLELLAPTFLALTLTCFFRRKLMILGISLALNLIICAFVVPINYARQKFDNEFLKVEIPRIQDLDKSLVLMVGDEATSYIVPWFPASTRFVRISSNLLFPGRNQNLDRKIREILEKYDASRILMYAANAEEIDVARLTIAYFRLTVDDRPCREIRARAGIRGYLCGVMPPPKPGEPGRPALSGNLPQFQNLDSVRLELSPQEALAGKDTLLYRVVGMTARAIDVLYTLDEKPMPPVRNWSLDPQQCIRIYLGEATRRGQYHIIGIRVSDSADRNLWIRVDARVRIR